MNNKLYLVLYYISFLVTTIFLGFSLYKSIGLLEYFDGSFSDVLSRILSNVFSIINVFNTIA